MLSSAACDGDTIEGIFVFEGLSGRAGRKLFNTQIATVDIASDKPGYLER